MDQSKDGFADASDCFLYTAIGQADNVDVACLGCDRDCFESVVEGEPLSVVFADLDHLRHLEIDEGEGGDGFVAQFEAGVDGGGFLDGGNRLNPVAGLIGHA